MSDEIKIEMTYFIDWLWMQPSVIQEMWDVDPDGLMKIFLEETNNGTVDLDAVRNGNYDNRDIIKP